MAENRTPRDLVSREKTSRYVYVPPSTLPDPTPDPDWAFRWVATHLLGQANVTNVSQQMRDGWEPVKAVDHPELQLQGNTNGNVEIGGLMLCKMPIERFRGRTDHFKRVAQSQMESVDNTYMRQNDPRMPLFADRKSTSTRGVGFGSGTK
jgi:hypothetical protein